MEQHKRRLDRILEEGFLDGLQDRPLEEIRIMRSDVADEEALLSYERRLVHGRLAILRAELDRRASGATESILDRLPAILADERRGSRGSFPVHDPDLSFAKPSRRISRLVSDDTLANLGSLQDDELRRYVRELEDAERDVSSVRSQVIATLDALNLELGRRYASGEADPGDVLAGP